MMSVRVGQKLSPQMATVPAVTISSDGREERDVERAVRVKVAFLHPLPLGFSRTAKSPP